MKISVIITCLLIIFALLSPPHAWAQQKEPAPQKKELIPANIQNIAFIDPVKLRREYKAYAAAKEKIYKDGQAKKKSYEQAMRKINEQSKQPQQVSDTASTGRYEIERKYAAEVKQRNSDRIALMKVHEEKINVAVQAVKIEGAFTEVRPIKDAATVKGTDITDKVLQKLNQ